MLNIIGFHYLSHQTCDGNSGIITDVYVTSGNISDKVPHCERILYQIKKFNFDTKEICADAGYYSSEIHTEMYKRGIKTYIPIRKAEKYDNIKFTVDDFKYIEDEDYFLCPNGAKLLLKSYKLNRGTLKYVCSKEDCSQCKLHKDCTKQNQKDLVKSLNYKYSLKQNLNIGTERYYELMRLRKI